MDLQAYFAREAAVHRLPVLMARQRERDAAMRSARTAKGNRNRNCGENRA